MAERIEVPPTLQGDEKEQLQQVWSYLYQMSETLNNNLEGIGGNELTDSERKTMQMILSAGEKAPELSEVETLKSLIIKTADFVQTNLQEYKLNLLGETVASGKFGRYVRSTGLDVAVTPEGITQNYSFQEIIQGLKLYEINAKNYIKTGLLRTVDLLPVYGVAIGKDVVTFAQDGTETYNDGNKVAELTADELSFWQNNVKIASYTGGKITFYQNSQSVMELTKDELSMFQGGVKIASYKAGVITFYQSGNPVMELTASELAFKQNNAKVASFTGSAISFLQGGNSVMDLTGSELAFKQNNEKVASFTGSAISFLQGGNSVMELTGSALKFKQSNKVVLQVTASRISFYYNGTETFYIENGVLNSLNDLNISSSKKVKIGDWTFNKKGLHHQKSGQSEIFHLSHSSDYVSNTPGIYYNVGDNDGYLLFSAKSPNYSSSWRIYVPNDGTVARLRPDVNGQIGDTTHSVLKFYGQKFFGHSNNIRLCPDINDENFNLIIQKGNSNTLDVLGDGRNVDFYGTYHNYSSREIKHDIRPLEDMGDVIDQLEPVSFVYNDDTQNRKRLGLIYEDTIGILPEICTGDDMPKSIDYTSLVPVLLKEIQQLRERVKALEERAE